jgi:hypothetical protein|tara:strand:- start:238 stop:453 length:216 start_codon:yes stop_codon:yes gene_type:complete
MERKIIILLTLILIGIGVTNCAKPKVNNDPVDKEVPTVQNLEAIANVLGCMFDPTPCQEKKDLAKTEEGKQ